jgi:hypothetical protein
VFGNPVVDTSKTVVLEVETWSPTISPTKKTSSRGGGSDDTSDALLIVIVSLVGGVLLITLIICGGLFWFKYRVKSSGDGASVADPAATVSKQKTTIRKAAPSSRGQGALDSSTLSVDQNPLQDSSRSTARLAPPVRVDDQL